MKILTMWILLTYTSVFAAVPSGVTFYAGLEDSINANFAVGDGTGSSVGKNISFRPGLRGKALLVGDGEALIRYSAEKNLLLPEGSIELWVKPLDWKIPCWGFHIFMSADGENNSAMLLYKYAHLQGGLLFYLSDGKGRTAQSSPPVARGQIDSLPGTWHQLVAVWSGTEITSYFDGKRSGVTPVGFPLPARMLHFRIGDDPWKEAASTKGLPPELSATAENRNAHTLLDEVYFYNRALTEEEVAWTFANSQKRTPGSDIPVEVVPAITEVKAEPDVDNKKLLVDIKANTRFFSNAEGGEVYLNGPEELKSRGTFVLDKNGLAKVKIDCPSFPAGNMEVRVLLKEKSGRILGEGKTVLVSPGPPVWRGNRIGITAQPPEPFTPIRSIEGGYGFSCWNRKVSFDRTGFIKQIKSGGKEILAEPMALEAESGGKPVLWKGKMKKVEADANRIVWNADARSSIGRLTSTITAEYDGMIRYDFTLIPSTGMDVDRLELKIPFRADLMTLSYLATSPEGQVHPDIYSLMEALKKTAGLPEMVGREMNAELPWTIYVWLGNEDMGISGVVESDEAWDSVDRKDMFRIESQGKSVSLVWSFARKNWELPNPWKFTIGIQATPTKDPGHALRARRFGKPEYLPGGNTHILTVWYPASPHEGYLGVSDPVWFDNYLRKNYTEKGISPIHYSFISKMDSSAPEYAFYLKKYRSSERLVKEVPINGWGKNATEVVAPPAPEHIDYVLWKAHQLLTRVDYRGLYFDLTLPYPSDSEAAGFGYVPRNAVNLGKPIGGLSWQGSGGARNAGTQRRPTYPVFATRKMYQRIYTMLKEMEKERGYDMFMVNHQGPWAWIGTYCDFVWAGEGFKEDYRRVFTPMLMRNLRGAHLGYRTLWLPQPPATGIHRIDDKNQPEQPTRYLTGMLLLHDMDVTATYCNIKVLADMFSAIDRFGGIADTTFFPYWKKKGVTPGQSETGVLCSAYVKPQAGNGSLLCAVNMTDKSQKSRLTLDFKLLNAGGKPAAKDLLTGEATDLDGNVLEVNLAPYDYVLIEVK